MPEAPERQDSRPSCTRRRTPALVLVQERDFGPTDPVLGVKGAGTERAGTRDHPVHLLEEAMTLVILVRQNARPLRSRAIEHEFHVVPGLGELLRGHHGVDDPGQVPVRLGVREHDDRCLGHDRSPLDIFRDPFECLADPPGVCDREHVDRIRCSDSRPRDHGRTRSGAGLAIAVYSDRRERGSPKCGSTLVSKRVMAQILVSLRVSTMRPLPWLTPSGPRR